MKEADLEFVSVKDDEEYDNLNSAYIDPSAASYEGGNAVIGSYLFNQSKVLNSFLLNSACLIVVAASTDDFLSSAVQDLGFVHLHFWVLDHH